MIDVFLSRLQGVKETAGGWQARCPAHADESPSLSISRGREQEILCYCFAGCEYKDIMAAVGMSQDSDSPIIAPARVAKPLASQSYVSAADVSKTISHAYARAHVIPLLTRLIHDGGREVIGKLRIGAASDDSIIYWQCTCHGHTLNGKKIKYLGYNRVRSIPASHLFTSEDGYETGVFGAHLLPLSGAETVFLVESEKSAALASAAMGALVLAVGGANGYTEGRLRPIMDELKYRKVYILPDNDEAGERGAKKGIDLFRRYGVEATTIRYPRSFPKGYDLGDEIIGDYSG